MGKGDGMSQVVGIWHPFGARLLTQVWGEATALSFWTLGLLTGASRWKSSGKWCECIDTMYYIYTTQYYSTPKRNGLSIHPVSWMNLENIMLRERYQ